MHALPWYSSDHHYPTMGKVIGPVHLSSLSVCWHKKYQFLGSRSLNRSLQTVQTKEKLLCLHVLYFARYTLQTLEILCFELPQPHFSVPIGFTIKCAFVRRWFVPTHVCVVVNHGSRPVHSHREEWSTLPGCSKVMHSCQ